MADKSLITQEQMQSDLEQFYSQKIYPYLNGATHAGFTPVGSVIAIMGNEAPNHYLACDGTLYTIADYPQLTAYFEDQFGSVNYFGGDGTTTFAVPDLRGEFLRGTGTNSHSGQGSGANVGTHQDATVTGIISISSSSKQIQIKDATDWGTDYKSNIDKVTKKSSVKTTFITASSGQTIDEANVNCAYTSRPTNTSVLWCIAYENTYIDGSGESSGGGHKIQNEGDLEPLTQRKTMLLNEPLVASDDAEGGNTVIDVDTDVDLSVIQAPGTAGNVDGHIYSTDETVVGKWVDGRNVYEKTIEIPSTTLDTTNYTPIILDTTNLSIKDLINSSGSVKRADYPNQSRTFGTLQINPADMSKIYYISTPMKRDDGSCVFNIYWGGAALTIYGYLIIQYTKTTDTV